MNESNTAGAVHTAVADTTAGSPTFEYSHEKKVFQTVAGDHEAEVTAVARRRWVRKNRISLKEARDKGQILSDEMVIPDRTVDSNIRIEKSPYAKYIEGSTTVLSFEDPSYPQQNLQPLAVWHAGISRVGSWKLPHFFAHDALLLHGAAYMEVVYDQNAPSHSVREYIRREDLIFPKGTRNFQACGRVYRRYETTKANLNALSKQFQFDTVQLEKIKTAVKSSTEAIQIYKAFMRNDDGVLYIAWMADEKFACSDYLKKPTLAQLGLFVESNGMAVPAPLTQIPIFVLPYHVEEDEEILDIQGRAALDIHVQDCLQSLWSGTTNGVTRASRFYPTRKLPLPGQEVPRSSESPVLQHGVIFEGDIDTFQPAWPNSIAVLAAQSLSSKKAQEIGATDYAAGNRQDTRKTATELTMAKEQADDLSGPGISLYSMCMLEMELLGWRIVKSGILVEHLNNVPPEKRKFKYPASVPIEVILSPSLNVSMAADMQVVRRAQRQSRFLEHWPIVANTPFAIPYLETFLQETFPEEFVLWKQAVGQADQRVTGMTELLKNTLQFLQQMPPEALPPEQHQPFAQLLNTIEQAANPQENANA